MTETKYTILKAGCIETVTLTKGMLHDPRLSWKAKALFAYLKTFEEGHDFSLDNAMSVGKDGREAIRSGLKELQKHGYLNRHVIRNKGGQIIKHAIELQEMSAVEGENFKILSETDHNTRNPYSGSHIVDINKKDIVNIKEGESEGGEYREVKPQPKKKPRPYLHPDVLVALTAGWEIHMGKGTFPKKKVNELAGIRNKMVIDGPAVVERKMKGYMEEEKVNDNYRYVSISRFAQRYHLLDKKAKPKPSLGSSIEEAMS